MNNRLGLRASLSLWLAAMFALVTTLLVTTACDGSVLGIGEHVRGSGALETNDYAFTDFTAVDVSSAFVATITMADEYSVSVTADDNIMDLLLVKMTDNTLTIGLDGTLAVTNATLEVNITMPALSILRLSGATRATVSGFSSTDALTLEASGASSIRGDITAGSTSIDLSGASEIELEGTAAELTADVSGASRLVLADFLVTHADLVVSGASKATVNLTGRLDADVSGASRLTYIGEPTMGDISTSGASSLEAQ